MYGKKLYCFLFLWIPFGCIAQPYFELVGVEYSLLKGEVIRENQTVKTNGEWLISSFKIPVKLNQDRLLFNPRYESYKPDDVGLVGISLPVSYIRQYKNQKWKTLVSVIPRLSSDSKSVSFANYQLGSAVLAMYKKSEKLTCKFGAYYNNEYFGFYMLPLVGIDWQVNSKINFFGILPRTMNFEYRMAKNISTGLMLHSITNSYRLSSGDYFKVKDTYLKIYMEYYMTKNFVFNVSAGHSLFRKYSLGFKDGAVKEADLQYKDGMMIKAGVAWRIPNEESSSNK